MKRRIIVFVMVALTLISLIPISAWCVNVGMSVYVIAPSVFCNMEAHKALKQNGWSETKNIGTTDAILVVVHSSLSNPLSNRYDSLEELAKDAEDQLNIDGSKFHIYLFQRQGNSSVSQTRHINYKAE
jgi:hypothetical protein